MRAAAVTRAAAAALGLAALVATARPAAANGRFPRAQYAVIQPARDPTTIAVRATFGVLLSDDRGASFRFLCEEAFGYLDGADPALALGPDGLLLVGIHDGLLSMPATRCTARRVGGLDGQRVVDLASDPTGAHLFAALNSDEAVTVARVARSTDGGLTYTLSSTALPGVQLETVEVAPSDPTRVYASGVELASGRDVLYRSDDGGDVFRRTNAAAVGTRGWFVSGVDPAAPDVLYVRARLGGASSGDDAGAAPADASEGATALLRSDDGGDSLREIGRTAGEMRGFALSPDGRTLWMGGPWDGLLRSDDGAPFARVADVSVECLRFGLGALYVCETYVPGGVLLGRSLDRGATLEPVLRFSQIGPPPSCPARTIVGQYCPARWPAIRATIDPRDAAFDASVDGGGGMTPPRGCSCAAPPARAPRPFAFVAAMVLLIVRRRRSR